MALLKALNDSCRKDVELQRQKYRLRLAEVKSHKAQLKHQVKAELARPGTLAAAFTLGVLVAPGKKRREEGKREERADAKPAATVKHEAAENDQEADKKQKSKQFDPADLFGSVISAVVVRLATNWITGLGADTPAADKMQDADVDNSTRVEL